MVRFGRLTAVFLMLAAALVGAPSTVFAQAKIRIAVSNFENNSTWSWWGDNLGRAAADELATQLVQTGKFTVIERAQLDAILREQNLGASGAVTSATAAKVGKLLGVQLLLTGSITGLLDQAHLDWPARHRRQLLERREQGGCPPGQHRNRRSDDCGRGQGNKRMGGGYFKGVSAEQTFDQGAAQEALRPAVEQVVLKLSEQTASLQSMTPAAPEGQIVSTRAGSYTSTAAPAPASRWGRSSRCTTWSTRSRTPTAACSTR